MVVIIEEGRAASKSPHKKFGYFLSISQQEVPADIIRLLVVCHQSPSRPIPPRPHTVCTHWAGILAEKSSWDRQTDGKHLVWFGEIERKLAKLSMTTFAYRSAINLSVVPSVVWSRRNKRYSILFYSILPLNYFMVVMNASVARSQSERGNNIRHKSINHLHIMKPFHFGSNRKIWVNDKKRIKEILKQLRFFIYPFLWFFLKQRPNSWK